MKPIRWKSKYLTGLPDIDQRHRALTDILNDLAKESGKVEHCQDMNELHARLVETAEGSLSHPKPSSSDEAQTEMQRYQGEIRQLLKTSLPLPAKSGSACRHCGLCDQLDQRVTGWLP